MHWLTWIGLIFIALGTALTIVGQQKLNDKSNELLQAKSDKIAGLSQENIKLSSELSEINKEIAATVTGPDGHPKYPICGHLSLLHLYFYLRGMKKEENMVIQVPIRHTELKYESDGGAYYSATSGAFSSGHPRTGGESFCYLFPAPSFGKLKEMGDGHRKISNLT